MLGGFIGSLVPKKSLGEKKKHNMEVYLDKQHKRKKQMSKKADYIMEKVALKRVTGIGRGILGLLGRGGKAIGHNIETAVPIIKKTRVKVQKTKPYKYVEGKGKTFKTWVDEPKAFSDPKSKHYIKPGKYLNPTFKRQLATRSGQVLGFAGRHPVTTAAGIWVGGKFIAHNRESEHRRLLHNVANRPPHATIGDTNNY